MPISFSSAGSFSGAQGGPSILNNPTSLQFGPDGRLYVSEQNGSVNAFTIEQQGDTWVATAAETLVDANGNELVKSIQNHFDDGSESGLSNRQVTGIVVAGTADEPVLYISSSNPDIAQNGEEFLDTNSGVVTRASLNSTTNEWEVVDLVRGLPRSEENHAVNGMLLSDDGTKLLLQVGGNTNNGAPSSFFSYTNEYVLSGSVLELDLAALDALPTQTDSQGGQNNTPRDYKYDLPTLDDPNRVNAPSTVTQDFITAAAALDAVDIGSTMTTDQLAAFGIARTANADLTFSAPVVVITQELFDVFSTIGQDRLGTAFTDADARAAGFQENGAGLDLDGPWGGNDGLNMAILPADAPLRLYADGNRNAYDLARTPNGNVFSVDNGSNGGLGGAPATEANDEDGDGIKNEAISIPVNGSFGEGEPLIQIVEGGYYYHANPVRSNQNQSWTVYDDDGQPDSTVSVNFVQDISALVPDAVNIVDGFLIDPSQFATGPGQTLADLSEADRNARLLLSGTTINSDNLEQNDPDGAGAGQPVIEILGSSTNGITAYDSGGQAFGGSIDGALFVTQFNDNITLLNINDAGTDLEPVLAEGPDGIYGTSDDVVQDADGVLFIANNSLGVPLANPLDVVQGPNGTLWVAEIGGNEITVLAPADFVAGPDTDADNDGIENSVDPFIRDASNGTSVVIDPTNGPTEWEFSQDAGDVTPGPDGFGGGLTGVMIDGTTDFEQFFQSPRDPSDPDNSDIKLDNVKFVTAAGGGTTVIEEVQNGDPFQTPNNAEFFFHTGFQLAPNVETFTVTWDVFNPNAGSNGLDITNNFQQIGGYLGDGTQSNYLKIVAIATNNPSAGTAPTANIQVSLENGDAIADTFNLSANGIFDSANLQLDSKITFSLTIDPVAATALAMASYVDGAGQTVALAADPSNPDQVIDLSGSQVLETILGNNAVQGQTTGLAAGLFATNNGGGNDTFQAVFDRIAVTATEAEVPPVAGDDSFGAQIDQTLTIPVADLLANDTDANGDPLTVTAVSNAMNGTVSLDNGTVTFTPDIGFEGQASFDYTVSDGTDTDTGSVTVDVSNLTVLFRINTSQETFAALPNDPYGSTLDWIGTGDPGAQSGTQSGLGFSVNTGNISTHNIAGRDPALPNYVPQALFAGERWDPAAAPEMIYSFGGGDLAVGTYTANLFAGNGFGGTSGIGDRVFDIEIEGQLVFDNVDLVALFGHQTGGLLTWTGQVTDGTLDIEWLRDGVDLVENPTINGIEIIAGAVSEAPLTVSIVSDPTPTVNEADGTIQISLLTNRTVPADETVDITFEIQGVTATAGDGGDFKYNGGGTFASNTYIDTVSIAGSSSDVTIPIEILQDMDIEPGEIFTVKIVGLSTNAQLGAVTEATITIEDDDTTASGEVLYRVNAGGAEVAATDGGPVWSEDTQANNSPFLVNAGSNNDFPTNGSPNLGVDLSMLSGFNVPAEVIGIERWDNTTDANGEMAWAFDVAAGTETEVRLYLAELFTGLPDIDGSGDPTGDRIFSVSVDGAVPTAFANLDPYTLAGNAFNKGSVVTHQFISDGTIDLEFLHISENPAIKGIEIIAVDDDTAPADTVDGIEVVGGDLSSDPATPTQVQLLAEGSTTVVSNLEGGNNDRDFFTLSIPDGSRLVDIILDGFSTTDSNNLGFFGIKTGTDFVLDPAIPPLGVTPDGVIEAEDLDGGIIYGPSNVGVDLLPQMNNIGSGFDENALTGNITAWLNQGGDAAETTLTFVTEVIPQPNPVVAAINAGGPALTQNGIDFSEDQFSANGTPFVDGNGGNGPQPIFDGTIYETEQFGGSATALPLSYSIPVAPGNYNVELYFAEIFQSSTGSRVFDVEVEGQLVLDDLDILAQTGDINQPFVFNLPSTVSPDTFGATDAIDISFTASVDNAKVSGIVIREADDTSDNIAPTAALNQPLANITAETAAPQLIQVDFGDNIDLDETSINGDEIQVTDSLGNLLDVSLDSFDGTTATYAVAAPGGIWDNPDNDTYSVAVVAGSVVDATGNAIASTDLGSFNVTVADSAQVGAAIVSVTVNNDNVQSSNFGNNSFQITNTGDKKIAKVEIDVTNALYPDSVFDPFGVAGDTISKPLTINTEGGTGVTAPNNDSYIGAGGIDGFEAIQVLFDEAVNGGFDPGETLGFSVDMDPNSIAGAVKSTLDSGANPPWDIGGISGAELIGSTVTITFTDGSTATSQLQGAGNQAGSQTLVSQALPALPVSLTVNGLGTGSVGTYDEDGPSVIINGPAGQTARVVLTKGFIQPGENNFDEPYKSQLDNQLAALAASDFPANNAVEFQTIDILLTGQDQDISDLFDFSGVPIYDFVGEGQLPLGFVASVIDPDNSNLPVGPVTEPIYLQYDADRVTDQLLALYTFDEGSGSIVNDVSGVGTALDLSINNLGSVTWGDGVLTLDDPTLITSGGIATKLINGLTSTNEITLEAWLTPENTFQDGPARIATLSSDKKNRNFTLGQAGDTFDVRVRTTETTNNGKPAVASPDGSLTTDLTHIVYTRESDGDAAIYLNGELVITENVGGNFSTWDQGYQFALGNEFDASRAWLGTLDLIAIYNQSFDSNEVTQNFLAGPDTVLNTPPIAGDDSFTTDEDIVLTSNLFGNDTDIDGDALTASVVAAPSNGILDLSGDGDFTYTPNADFNGSDSFTYQINDGRGGTATATATITVNAVNDAPVAVDDDVNTPINQDVLVDVAANDLDADGNLDPTSAEVVTGPTNGTVINNMDGTFTYNSTGVGEDTFTYTIEDTDGLTSTATVNIQVTPTNDAPVAVADATTTDEDTTVDIDVAANDIDDDNNLDPASAVVVTGPTNGTVDNNGDGTFTYTPNPDFNGVDSFTYQISDTLAASDQATVTINIDPINDAPVAVQDDFSTDEGTELTFNVLANDTDVDGDSLTIQSFDPTTLDGMLVDNGNGSFTYTLNAGFSGTDTFSYTVSDGTETATTTANIEVLAGESRVTDQLLALYTFDEGSGNVVNDVSGVGTALDLTINDLGNVTWGDGILTLDDSTLVASVGAADKLIDGLTGGEVTIEAWISADNLNQDGPARIATLSGNIKNRNFTLGQDEDTFNVRLRTTSTNNNASRPSLSGGEVEANTLTHVLYTRGTDGLASLYVDNELVNSTNIGGDFSNWVDDYRFGLGNEFGSDRAWLGSYDLVAVYAQTFDSEEVSQNFLAGPGSTL